MPAGEFAKRILELGFVGDAMELATSLTQRGSDLVTTRSLQTILVMTSGDPKNLSSPKEQPQMNTDRAWVPDQAWDGSVIDFAKDNALLPLNLRHVFSTVGNRGRSKAFDPPQRRPED